MVVALSCLNADEASAAVERQPEDGPAVGDQSGIAVDTHTRRPAALPVVGRYGLAWPAE